MKKKQEEAIKKLKSAVRAMNKAGLTCFCTGDSMNIFNGPIPRVGIASKGYVDTGSVDPTKSIDSFDIRGWDAGAW